MEKYGDEKIGIVAMGFSENVDGCIRFETICDAILEGKQIEFLDYY